MPDGARFYAAVHACYQIKIKLVIDCEKEKAWLLHDHRASQPLLAFASTGKTRIVLSGSNCCIPFMRFEQRRIVRLEHVIT